jgi:hypothetical protein
MWEPRRLTTLWASTACYRDSFTLPQLLFAEGFINAWTEKERIDGSLKSSQVEG